jgi:hypothetical protein
VSGATTEASQPRRWSSRVAGLLMKISRGRSADDGLPDEGLLMKVCCEP